jgi:hypothetical protein
MAGINYDLYGGGLMGGYQAAQDRDRQNMLAQQQMQQVTRQNQLGEMQLAEAQRAQQEQNQLRQLYSGAKDVTSPEFVKQVYGVSPQQGMAYEETLGKRQKAMTEGQKAQVDLVDAKLKQSKEFLQRIRTPEEFAAWNASQFQDAHLGPILLAQGATPEKVQARIDQALSQPGGFEKLLQESQIGVEKFREMNKPQVVSPGASVYQDGKIVVTAPEKESALPASAQEFALAQKDPKFMQFLQARAAAGRAPAAPSAPTITTVVNPNNPKEMISIDARQYRGGGMGSPGVIGLAGKEPKSAADEQKQIKGREDVDVLIAQLRNNYNNLQAAGDITSSQNRGGTNLAAGIGSSGIGQATGRLFGTASQSERNSIAQTRPLLLAAIKNATGMSAKQMDSNVEMQMYLRSATDPSLDYEANMRALSNLEKLMGSSSGGGAKAGVDSNNPLLK